MLSTFKIALKVLLRRKFFTFVSLFAVSFTLLVLLVAVAMLDHVFGPEGPERPDRMLVVVQAQLKGEHSRRNGGPGWALLHRTFPDLPGVERSTVFASAQKLTTYHEGRKVVVYARRTDGDYWKVFRFDFVEGGPFDAADEASASPVAVLSESARDRYFGAGPAVGKTFELDGRRIRVVGVVRDVSFARELTSSDVWIPTSLTRYEGYKQELVGNFLGAMLLAPGAVADDVSAEYARRVATLPIEDDTFQELTAPATSQLLGSFGRAFGGLLPRRSEAVMGILWLAALLFMGLPALNLVNLNLSRILERASEIGVRKSFGATSGALVRQFLVENVILSLIGGILAALLASGVLAGLNRSGVIPHSHFSLNVRVLGWGILLSIVFGVVSGVLPAWRMSRLHPVGALQGRFE